MFGVFSKLLSGGVRSSYRWTGKHDVIKYFPWGNLGPQPPLGHLLKICVCSIAGTESEKKTYGGYPISNGLGILRTFSSRTPRPVNIFGLTGSSQSFLLRSGRPIPAADFVSMLEAWKSMTYGGYPISNGLGILRTFSSRTPRPANILGLTGSHSFLLRSERLISADDFVSKLEAWPDGIYLSKDEFCQWLTTAPNKNFAIELLMEGWLCVVATNVELLDSIKTIVRESPRPICAYVDGSYDPNTGDAGIGVVFVSEFGTYISHVSKHVGRLSDPEEAELSALEAAIKIAQDLNYHDLIVYSDCKNMVHGMNPDSDNFLAAQENFPDIYAELLVEASKITDFKISFVFRERLTAADFCAYTALRNLPCPQDIVETLVFKDHTMKNFRFYQKDLAIEEVGGRKVVTAGGVVVS